MKVGEVKAKANGNNCVLVEVGGSGSLANSYTLKKNQRLVFKPKTGYQFVGESYFSQDGNREDFYVDNKTGYGTIYFREWFTDVNGFHFSVQSINTQPTPAPNPTPTPASNPTPPPPPSVTSLLVGKLREKAKANNCDVYTVNGQSVSDNFYLDNANDKLVLKANDGYKFISVTYDDWIVQLDFVISEDGKFATSDYDFAKDIKSYEFNVVAVGTNPTPDPKPDPTPDNPIDNVKKGVNNLYLLGEQAAKRVMKERFFMMESERIKDKSDGIIGLIKLPFDFDSQYLAGDEFVRIGDYKSDIVGKVITTDTIVKNIGSIDIPKNNDNLLDYENVEIELFLPFCDSITLDKEKVIGHKIKIEYWVNLYNSEFLTIVKNDEYGVIESKKSSFDSSVPFNKLDVTPANNKFDKVNYGYNGINQAYIQIRHYKPILADWLFSALVDDELKLNDVRGFVEVEQIDLKTGATLDEQRSILTLLRNGVIIK